MNYSSARAFRQALEDRLRTNYPQNEIPRLRKMIAFERFMARLDEQWILKGGYALQLRTGSAETLPLWQICAWQAGCGSDWSAVTEDGF